MSPAALWHGLPRGTVDRSVVIRRRSDHSFDHSAGGFSWLAVEERWVICGVVATMRTAVGAHRGGIF